MLRVELAMQPGVQMPWPLLDAPLMLNGGALRQTLRGPAIMHVGRGH